MKFKIHLIHFLIFCAWMILLARGFQLQVLPHERLEARIRSQFATEVTVYAKRGDLYDRSGNLLATSVSSWSAFLDPQLVERKKDLVKEVSKALNFSPSHVRKLLAKKTRFAWLKRKLSDREYRKLISLDLKGLSFLEEHKRVYFNRDSLAHVVGQVDIDGRGVSGLELQYDKTLRGKPLKFKTLRDGKGRILVFSNPHVLNRLKGKDVHLALDVETQVFLTKALKEKVEESKAKRAWGLVMSTENGEILSSAQVGGSGLNVAASEIHEPGSVLKTFSFLRAMQEQSLRPVDLFSCGNEGFLIGRRKIRNSHKEEDCEQVSLLEAFAKSLNTVSAELALKTGEKSLLHFYKKMGLNTKTEVDFPGEVSPYFHNKLSGPHHLAALSFGQGVSINAFQLLRAYAAIGNEGYLVKPSYRLNPHGRKRAPRVLNKKSAFMARGLLASVVDPSGSGSKASVEGYLVGGKTGTSQKPDLEKGGYSKEVLSSFIGLYPLSQPKFVTYIVVDEPQNPRSGGAVAAPVFSKVADFLMRKEQIFPDKIDSKNVRSLAFREQVGRMPSAEQKKEVTSGKVPNLKGYSLREALRLAQSTGLKFKIEGSGKIQALYPAPGKPLPASKVVSLILK